jgi:hypothetical protein
MNHLSTIIRNMPLELFVALLPLSLGWPIAIWFAGGRGTAAASSLITMICRSLRMQTAAHADTLPFG